ncbi:MAG: DUF4238 domain-containing protein [Streptosporangiaceae bacterium]
MENRRGAPEDAGISAQRIAASLRPRPAVSRRRYGDGVSNGTRQVKRRYHTVNGSYLTRFADDRGLLAGIELPGRRFRVPVDRATVIRNFYVTRLPDGSESDQAEDDFCDIEARASASMKILIDQRRWPIPDTVRADIATWAALQYLRVPAVRQLASEIADAYIKVGVPFTTDMGEQTRLRMPDDEAAPENSSASTWNSSGRTPPWSPGCSTPATGTRRSSPARASSPPIPPSSCARC